jgi:hypothetical protein
MNWTSLCGADTPVCKTLAPKTANVSADAIWPAIVRAGRILVATLREIFDESAYQRFLVRHRLQSSAAAYAEFYREHAKIRTGPTKCC